ncbi:TIGR03757 family integrating conjugative element protein [Pseudomonas sp.]|uniref:TIGR03757 family integrating conjugative element protein n=1 Tax=Pseudomonas sp. TaxID=306 RepID=UPI002613AE24|nr:TIGR03757 family integrating conjugative element protein [Pseudomonas sp.]
MPSHQATTRISPSLVLSLAILSITTITQAQTWVITDQAHPITSSGPSRIILLDQQQHLEGELSRALPTDPHQAAAIVQSRLNTPSGKRLQADLAKAQQGLADAWSLGITKIPAVVVDRRYVVYGELDVDKALVLINNAKGQPQ